jgi:hypothetical protein
VYSFDGTVPRPIGKFKIDKFLNGDFVANFPDRVSSAVDPTLGIVAWAYPCEVAFWCFSLITYVVSYVVLWGVRLPPLYWTLMMVFGFVPPAILVWFMQNTWYEVLVSALIGCCLTLPLVLCMRYLLHPKDLSIMLKQRPWTWLSAIDTHLRTIEEMDRAAAAEKP